MTEQTDALRLLHDLPHFAFDEKGLMYGPVDPGPDTFVRSEDLAAVLPVLAQQQENLKDSNSVCACGCADVDHENYGEDGKDCDLPGHECVRTNRAVLEMLNSLRQQLAEAEATRQQLQEDSDVLRHRGIIEIAVRNESGSVRDYMNHWEGRALKAEAAFQEAEATRRSLDAHPLSFAMLQETNKARCESAFHSVDSWKPWEWSNAMAGECGEACNVTKKMNRIWPANQFKQNWNKPEDQRLDELADRMADEVADTVIYADLLMTSVGRSLATAIVKKFNEKSDEIGSAVKLAAADTEPARIKP